MAVANGALRRPRCLHVLPETRQGGAENQARYLLAGLKESGEVEPELAFFSRGAQHAAFEALGIPMLEVGRHRRLILDLLPRARRVRRSVSNQPPELIHTWLLEGNLVGLLAARGWPSTGVIVTQRGGANERDYPHHLRLQRLLRGRVDAGISNSASGTEVLREAGLGEAQIWTVENGIPDDQLAGSFSRAEARRELGLGAETVLLWVGRAGDLETVRQKGLDVLFAALTRLREEGVAVELVLIGPALGDLRLAGIELPDWARAVGWRSRPTELMPAADALVVSSRFEGSSNVALEALMLGIPVVSTSSGDHAALVDAAGGALAAPGDARSLADAVARILADPPDRLHIKATAAPALSMDRVVAETLAVYRAVLAHRGSG